MSDKPAIADAIREAQTGNYDPARQAIKRYIHNTGAKLKDAKGARLCKPYNGPDGPQPIPSELSQLVRVLMGRFSDSEPLQEFISQDQHRLTRGTPTSGLVLPGAFSINAWHYAALKADEWLDRIGSEGPIIELVPAGYRLRGGKIESLSGKPLAVLRVFLDANNYRVRADDIRRQVWPDESITYPEQAVTDNVGKLRESLREALRRMGVKSPSNPIPSTGRGDDLTYQLDLSVLLKR